MNQGLTGRAMSLRMIARDLYRLQQEVDRLESRLKECPPAKREEFEDELRKAKAERDRVKRMLEGAKEEPPYRKPR
jgi:hypothetical protein